jgi:hypothetical protein
VGSVRVAFRLTYRVEDLRALGWVVDGADEFEIATIGRQQQTPQVAQAVDRLQESELLFESTVPMFHRAVG